MTPDRQEGDKPSFIAEARREQIIAAAIQTLDEIGYVNASLAQIARRAGISTALISYHFADKSDLMDQVLIRLIESAADYVIARVRQETTPPRQLITFIEASLAYQGTHPERNAALLEIIFNARTPENLPYYKMDDETEDELLQEVKRILTEGQTNGDFGAFNLNVMANVIQGAIGEYVTLAQAPISKQVDLETYSRELISIIGKAVRP